jgi:hypothetical protein
MAYTLKEFQELSTQLKSENARRNSLYTAMEDIFFMRWDEEGKVRKQQKVAKITKSPTPRNKLLGAMRLMIATDPLFDVPGDVNNTAAKEQASKIERFCKAMWNRSGRVRGDPVHYDLIRSALLYSEIHIAVTATRDILAALQKGKSSPGRIRRAEDLVEKTPYLFDVTNPKQGYAVRSKLGLDAFISRVATTYGKVREVWGGEADGALGKLTAKMNRVSDNATACVLCEGWDLDVHVVWLEGVEAPILEVAHGLPYIPIVAQVTEGSMLFENVCDQREPFLYSVHESDIWKRQNLVLSAMFSLTFGLGANPMFKFSSPNPDAEPNVDFDQPGGWIKLGPGEDFAQLGKQVIDPSLLTTWQILNALEEESTIRSQVLGESIGASSPYSALALLSQAGRLPLAPTQRKTSWGIGEACEIALACMKKHGVTGKAYYDQDDVTLAPEDIPDRLTINAQLEISMPQDKLQNANIATMLAGGENPIAPMDWVRENVLGEGQPEEMRNRIWTEQAANAAFQKYMFEQMAQIAQLKQVALMPGQASGMPGMPGQGAPIAPVPGADQGSPMAPPGPNSPMGGGQPPMMPAPPMGPPPQEMA